ncbi:MAG: hypothetical protein H6644_00560 [Caldilineaceae bacterium]|nr:hypothetical protein [Caldilineaceae bacterium]
MQTWNAVGTMAGIFVLRLGLPLVVTFGVAWWLRRLDTRWQAEARAAYIADRWGRSDAPPAVNAVQTSPTPCWVVRGCTAEDRAACAAHGQPNVPCWVVRLRREGKLPKACLKCELFAAVQSMNIARPNVGRPTPT